MAKRPNRRPVGGFAPFLNVNPVFKATRLLGLLSLALLAAVALSACSSDSNGDETDGDEAPITEGTWYRPSTSASWNWQLTGPLQTENPVDIHVFDFYDTSEEQIDVFKSIGRRVLCHLSVGTYDSSLGDPVSVNTNDLGNPVIGNEKARYLNIRSPRVRDVIAARIDEARKRGCNGIVPDHMDTYLVDTGFPITATDQVSFDRWMANEAHRNRLSVGMKNLHQQVPLLHEYFDFAVTERCHESSTCEAFAPFTTAGKAVFNAEYAEQYLDPTTRATMCGTARTAGLRTLVLPPALDGSYRFSCDS